VRGDSARRLALGTRRGSQETWESLAHQAATGGTAAHDAALGALLAATAANQPDRWRSVSIATGELASSLQQLLDSAPDDRYRVATERALDAVTALDSAVDVAATAPSATPLYDAAAHMLRQRLDETQAALTALGQATRER
jgi:hypothetical protein